MLEPVRIGFSTTTNPLSGLIRWLTRSKVSHAFLVYYDVDFRRDMVMEAEHRGFRIVPFDRFSEHNTVIAVFEPRSSLDEGLVKAVDWLGEDFDVRGLFRMAWLIVSRGLKARARLRRRNLLVGTRSLFCSEAVARVLLGARYPGFDRDPETTSPEDLYEFFHEEQAAGEDPAGRPATSRALRRPAE